MIDYIRDASTTKARERLDLAVLLDDVIEDAVIVGGDVRTVAIESAPVDVDALGMRRVLDNLLANAIKYGGRARLRPRGQRTGPGGLPLDRPGARRRGEAVPLGRRLHPADQPSAGF